MKREYIGTGKTVDEAIEAACTALGCERSEIEFEILALAKKSFFGLRTTPAQVKVTWEDGTPEPRANRPQEGRREKKAEKPAEKPAYRSKKQRAQQAKMRADLRSLEQQLDKMQEELDTLTAELTDEAVCSDYQLMQEKCQRMEELRVQMDETMEQMILLEEELG